MRPANDTHGLHQIWRAMGQDVRLEVVYKKRVNASETDLTAKRTTYSLSDPSFGLNSAVVGTACNRPFPFPSRHDYGKFQLEQLIRIRLNEVIIFAFNSVFWTAQWDFKDSFQSYLPNTNVINFIKGPSRLGICTQYWKRYEQKILNVELRALRLQKIARATYLSNRAARWRLGIRTVLVMRWPSKGEMKPPRFKAASISVRWSSSYSSESNKKVAHSRFTGANQSKTLSSKWFM